MIKTLTDEQKLLAKAAAQEYYDAKEIKPSEAVLGFIKRNAIIGKTTKEIDALIESAKKLRNGVILGDGDKFKAWCKAFNREVPNDDLVRFMNADPFDAKKEIRRMIPEHPKLWKALCSYLAGRGRSRV